MAEAANENYSISCHCVSYDIYCENNNICLSMAMK